MGDFPAVVAAVGVAGLGYVRLDQSAHPTASPALSVSGAPLPEAGDLDGSRSGRLAERVVSDV
ncbi:hypothetical protein [Rhodococcus sp. RCBS9]|uniref:hypothetical protein n=1 Tax=Rhodococcus sp. RCBS9 TaxID=3031999 RepID=UPI0023F8E048|nr:hypothetical protein [Rhodococcus sp. RCBS9]WEX01067.1 hypothetical protein P0M12_15390 [Rhodococcus sp. RCBS9]